MQNLKTGMMLPILKEAQLKTLHQISVDTN